MEPGLEHMYSKSSDRITSTMKSEPQCSVVKTSTSAGMPLSARASCMAPLTALPPQVVPEAPLQLRRQRRRPLGISCGLKRNCGT
jgi:hypothetical protein